MFPPMNQNQKIADDLGNKMNTWKPKLTQQSVSNSEVFQTSKTIPNNLLNHTDPNLNNSIMNQNAIQGNSFNGTIKIKQKITLQNPLMNSASTNAFSSNGKIINQ